MKKFHIAMAPQFQQRLASRAAELREILHGQFTQAGSADVHEVSDFKDAAEQDSLAARGDAQAARAATELEQVRAAEQRIASGSFGLCVDCDEPIDLRRLTALPATAYCTGCQAVHEQSSAHDSRVKAT